MLKAEPIGELRMAIWQHTLSTGAVAYSVSCPYIEKLRSTILPDENTLAHLVSQASLICKQHASPEHWKDEEPQTENPPEEPPPTAKDPVH